MEVMSITVEKSKSHTEEKVSELNTRVTKIEEITEENKFLINLNKSTAISNLEQNGFNLEKIIQSRFAQMNLFTLAEERGNFIPDITWKISGIGDMVKQTSFEIKSEMFKWTGYPEVQVQAKMKVSSNGYVDMSLCLEQNNNGASIEMKLIPHVYYVLKDQTKTNNPKHRCSTTYHPFTSKFNYSLDFASRISDKSHLIDPAYNVNDAIVVNIYVETPSMTQSVHSRNGTLNWAIDNFRKKKLMAKEGLVMCHESPYCYTWQDGYRVQVHMWLRNGLNASIYILAGEFDDDLPLTFPHETTVTLFNRQDPRRNITKTVEKDMQTEENYYSIELCTDEEIENVLINDVIFYKIVIKPSN